MFHRNLNLLQWRHLSHRETDLYVYLPIICAHRCTRRCVLAVIYQPENILVLSKRHVLPIGAIWHVAAVRIKVAHDDNIPRAHPHFHVSDHFL